MTKNHQGETITTREVSRITGLSTGAIHNLKRQKRFPQPEERSISEKIMRWPKGEVMAWERAQQKLKESSMKIQEVAAFIGRSPAYIADLVKRGGLPQPFTLPGERRALRLDRAVVEAWFNAHDGKPPVLNGGSTAHGELMAKLNAQQPGEISFAEVMSRTKLTKEKIYELRKKKQFPEPARSVRGQGGRLFWIEDVIMEWIKQNPPKKKTAKVPKPALLPIGKAGERAQDIIHLLDTICLLKIIKGGGVDTTLPQIKTLYRAVATLEQMEAM